MIGRRTPRIRSNHSPNRGTSGGKHEPAEKQYSGETINAPYGHIGMSGAKIAETPWTITHFNLEALKTGKITVYVILPF